MKEVVRKSARITVIREEWSGGQEALRSAAKLIREFLLNFKAQISAWRPWMKYAVAAVIAILDILINDEGE